MVWWILSEHHHQFRSNLEMKQRGWKREIDELSLPKLLSVSRTKLGVRQWQMWPTSRYVHLLPACSHWCGFNVHTFDDFSSWTRSPPVASKAGLLGAMWVFHYYLPFLQQFHILCAIEFILHLEVAFKCIQMSWLDIDFACKHIMSILRSYRIRCLSLAAYPNTSTRPFDYRVNWIMLSPVRIMVLLQFEVV